MKAKNIKSNNNMISHNLRPKVFSLPFFVIFNICRKRKKCRSTILTENLWSSS